MAPVHAAAISPLLIGFARCAAFAGTMPLASSGMLARFVRPALALTLTPIAVAHDGTQTAAGTSLYVALPVAVLWGAALGLSASVVAAAAAAAGGLIDAVLGAQFIAYGGSSNSSGVFARLFSIAFAALFFLRGAATALIAGVAGSGPLPAHAPPASAAVALGRLCIEWALMLAAPALCAQFFATMLCCGIARVAPRINGMLLNAPLAWGCVLVAVFAGAPAFVRELMLLAADAAGSGLRGSGLSGR